MLQQIRGNPFLKINFFPITLYIQYYLILVSGLWDSGHTIMGMLLKWETGSLRKGIENIKKSQMEI